MTTTPTSGAADLLDLIEAYAEARHRQGHSSYNAQTATALQAVKDALAAGQATAAPAQPDPAYSAACHLATALFKKHFAHLPDFASGQAVWGLCGSTAGVISQIDNMVSGLVQPPTTAFSEDEL